MGMVGEYIYIEETRYSRNGKVIMQLMQLQNKMQKERTLLQIAENKNADSKCGKVEYCSEMQKNKSISLK